MSPVLPTTSPKCRNGFTLIETVAALSIATTLAAAGAIIAVQTLRAERTLRAAVQRERTLNAALTMFADDISAIPQSMFSEPATIGPGTDEPGLLIRIVAPTPLTPSESMIERFLPSVITWHVIEVDNEVRVVRKALDLTSLNAAPVAQTVIDGVVDARVEYLVDELWATQVERTSSSAVRAVRLTLSFPDAPPASRTVVLSKTGEKQR